MKKTKSTAVFIIAITWILVSLMWFFIADNNFIGIVWLIVGLLELVIATMMRVKESKEKL
ncbi:MAG: hypothetical protein SOY42_13755 [Clostridium sp.]|nr:hypothetical protein [Clostridium sp.]